jgi:curved DNA-binding protein
MAVRFQDYYETLGVARTAPAEEIKQAFRRLARLHHPDVAKNKVTGEAKFKEINEAYEVLGDPEKRRRYDELGPDWREGGRGPFAPGGGRGDAHPAGGAADFEFSGTGFSDFFESFFSGRPGDPASARGPARRGRAERESARPGGDIEADLLVTLEEALRGAQRKVTLRRPAMDGAAERTDTYQVKIPAGLREGQRIRLAGQGGPGRGGAPMGDLYLRVRFARHPDLRVEGDDIHCDLDLAPWEAVLGAKATVPTLAGATTLRVPPGTTAGTRLRVRGQGLPREDGIRGDHYATVRLVTPEQVTAEERVLWEQLARLSPFQPRSES